MIRFKSIVIRLRNAIIRAVGIKPRGWNRSVRTASNPPAPAQSPTRGEAITISLSPTQPTSLSSQAYTLLTQAPLQLNALEKAQREASKIHFNRSSAYTNVLSRPNGISVNGSDYPLPTGIKYAKSVFESSIANSL